MIKLSLQSQKLLKQCLEKFNPSLLWTMQKEREYEITIEIYNDLRESVSNELITSGFNNDGSINEYGVALETLIDEIGDLFM